MGVSFHKTTNTAVAATPKNTKIDRRRVAPNYRRTRFGRMTAINFVSNDGYFFSPVFMIRSSTFGSSGRSPALTKRGVSVCQLRSFSKTR